MFKIVLATLFALSAFISNAQIVKGTRVLTGGISISGNSQRFVTSAPNTRSSNFSLGVSPSIGWFVKDNFVLGPILNYGMSVNKINQGPQGSEFRTESKDAAYGGGLFLRKYKNITDNLLYFTQFSAGYNYITTEVDYQYDGISPGYSTPVKGFGHRVGASLSPGLTYFITPKFAIEARFGAVYYNYTEAYRDNDANTVTNLFGADLGLSSLNFGAGFYF